MKELIFKSEKVDDTKKLANIIAPLIRKGDLILLKGELGIGKTTFVRAIINSEYFANDDKHIVPSPTFSLVQTYEFNKHIIGHADLYRIDNLEEILALDLQSIVDEGTLLVEWPEIIESSIFANTLKINFELQNGIIDIAIMDEGGWNDRIRSISIE